MLKNKTYLFDGSIGSYLSQLGYKYPVSILNVKNKKIVENVHREYLDVGVDIITTNTFSADLSILSKYGYEKSIQDININGVKIAKKIILEYKDKMIAGSIGPGYFNLDKKKDRDNLKRSVSIQSEIFINLDVDIILLETILSITGAKISLDMIYKNIQKANKKIEIFLSFSADSNLNEIELFNLVKKYNIKYFGFNCGKDFKSYNRTIKTSLAFPSAGIPKIKNNKILYPINEKEYLLNFSELIKRDNPQFIGGCCGTTPKYIKELKNYLVKNI